METPKSFSTRRHFLWSAGTLVLAPLVADMYSKEQERLRAAKDGDPGEKERSQDGFVMYHTYIPAIASGAAVFFGLRSFAPSLLRAPGKIALASAFVAAVGLGSSININRDPEQAHRHEIAAGYMDEVGTVGLMGFVIAGGQWFVKRRKPSPALEPEASQPS